MRSHSINLCFTENIFKGPIYNHLILVYNIIVKGENMKTILEVILYFIKLFGSILRLILIMLAALLYSITKSNKGH